MEMHKKKAKCRQLSGGRRYNWREWADRKWIIAAPLFVHTFSATLRLSNRLLCAHVNKIAPRCISRLTSCLLTRPGPDLLRFIRPLHFCFHLFLFPLFPNLSVLKLGSDSLVMKSPHTTDISYDAETRFSCACSCFKTWSKISKAKRIIIIIIKNCVHLFCFFLDASSSVVQVLRVTQHWWPCSKVRNHAGSFPEERYRTQRKNETWGVWSYFFYKTVS